MGTRALRFETTRLFLGDAHRRARHGRWVSTLRFDGRRGVHGYVHHRRPRATEDDRHPEQPASHPAIMAHGIAVARPWLTAMVFVMFGSKGKARRVPDGRVETRQCPSCGKTTTFHECEVETTFTAYHFVDLWSSKSTQFACGACGAMMTLDETSAPELSPRERAAALAAQAKAAAIAAKEAVIAAKQAALQRLEDEREAARRKQDREQAVEDELAAMKARIRGG